MTTTSTRTYYGFSHTYGANMRDEDSNYIGKVEEFSSKAERDAWVSEGSDYTTESGARTTITASSPEVRAYLKHKKAYGY